MWGQSSAGRRGSWQDTAERDCGNLYRISGVPDALIQTHTQLELY